LSLFLTSHEGVFPLLEAAWNDGAEVSFMVKLSTLTASKPTSASYRERKMQPIYLGANANFELQLLASAKEDCRYFGELVHELNQSIGGISMLKLHSGSTRRS